jgi:hypothetical protein
MTRMTPQDLSAPAAERELRRHKRRRQGTRSQDGCGKALVSGPPMSAGCVGGHTPSTAVCCLDILSELSCLKAGESAESCSGDTDLSILFGTGNPFHAQELYWHWLQSRTI